MPSVKLTFLAALCLLCSCAREPLIAPQVESIVSAAPQDPAGPNRLTEAAYAAMQACMVVEAQSIDHCGAMPGRSPELSAARTAVATAYKQRSAYVDGCTDGQTLAQCTWQADFDIQVGLSRALDPP